MNKEKLQTLIVLLKELQDEYTTKWVQAFNNGDVSAFTLNRISDECFSMKCTCERIHDGSSYTQYSKEGHGNGKEKND